MTTLPELLKTLMEMNGSDLHLTADTPPQIRVHGDLQRLSLPVLTPADTKQLAYSVLTDSQKKRFEDTKELDFSFGLSAISSRLEHPRFPRTAQAGHAVREDSQPTSASARLRGGQ